MHLPHPIIMSAISLRVLDRPIDPCQYLDRAECAEFVTETYGHTRTARPLGSTNSLDAHQDILGRDLKPKKSGRKPKKRTR